MVMLWQFLSYGMVYGMVLNKFGPPNKVLVPFDGWPLESSRGGVAGSGGSRSFVMVLKSKK